MSLNVFIESSANKWTHLCQNSTSPNRVRFLWEYLWSSFAAFKFEFKFFLNCLAFSWSIGHSYSRLFIHYSFALATRTPSRRSLSWAFPQSLSSFRFSLFIFSALSSPALPRHVLSAFARLAVLANKINCFGHCIKFKFYLPLLSLFYFISPEPTLLYFCKVCLFFPSIFPFGSFTFRFSYFFIFKFFGFAHHFHINNSWTADPRGHCQKSFDTSPRKLWSGNQELHGEQFQDIYSKQSTWRT